MMSDHIQNPVRRSSRRQTPSLKMKENEESRAIEKFFKCYGNITRLCDSVEEDLSRKELPKKSRCSMELLIDNLKLHQSKLYEASSRMKNTAIAPVSTDILSLDQRTDLRLARLIRKISDQLKVLDRASDATSTKGKSPMLWGENTSNASLQNTMPHVSVKPKIDDVRSSLCAPEYRSSANDTLQESTYQRFDNGDDKKTKKGTTTLSSHGSSSKKSTIQSLQNLYSMLHPERNQCIGSIDDTVAPMKTTTHTIVSKDGNCNVSESKIQCKPVISINKRENKARSSHSTADTRNSRYSSTHYHLLQQREQLEHQISIARQSAAQRALEASRERIRQMDLEQNLVDTQKQIDDISYTTSDVIQDIDHNELNQPEPLGNPAHSELPADIDIISKVFADAINLNKLPAPEPSVFYGNPLEYPAWKSSFDTLIGSKRIDPGDKIHYLKRYLGGDALSCVEGVFLFSTEAAYIKARDILQMRFGSDFAVAEAFREKLYNWQSIKPTDSIGLQRFSDFLQQCEMAQQCIKGLECLDDCRENQRILTKLPDYIIVKWNGFISDFAGYFPPFCTFASFILKEAEVACNPITSLNAVRAIGKHGDSQNGMPTDTKGNTTRQHDHDTPPTSSVFSVQSSTISNTEPTSAPSTAPCRYCGMSNHKLHNCKQFIALTPRERKEYIELNRLCFACLEGGHISKKCKLRKTCKLCQRRHPTCLHGDYNVLMKSESKEKLNESNPNSRSKSCEKFDSTEEAKILHASQGQSTSGMIVPVYLSTATSPDSEVLTYALLDTQSDTTFVLSNIGDMIQPTKHRSTLKLSTLTSTSYAECFKYNDLQIRGFNSDMRIPLPSTYSREVIPVHRSHIPTQETALKWPHLTRIHDEIPALQNCEVGLLIGYNCPQALAPRDFICGEGSVPYAQKHILGGASLA